MTPDDLVERWESPSYAGVLPDATHRMEGRGRTCDDHVILEARIAGNLILEIKHTCKACVLTTATADLLCELLQAGQPLPDDPFKWIGVHVASNRAGCILLPYNLAKELYVSLHL